MSAAHPSDISTVALDKGLRNMAWHLAPLILKNTNNKNSKLQLANKLRTHLLVGVFSLKPFHKKNMHEVNLASSSPQQFPSLTKNHPNKKKHPNKKFIPSKLAQLGGIFFLEGETVGFWFPDFCRWVGICVIFGIQTASATPGC